MASDPISYNKEDLRGILRAFKAMNDEAISEATSEARSSDYNPALTNACCVSFATASATACLCASHAGSKARDCFGDC